MRSRLVVMLASAFIGAGVVTATPALADDPLEIPVSYTVAGSSIVKKTGSALQLGPGQLNGAIVIDGDNVGIKGDLSLPPSKANISLLSGIFRIKATVKVIPLGQVQGSIKDGDLKTHALANMEISDIWAGPIIPVFPLPTVPKSCKTVSPISLDLITKDVDLFAPSITSTGEFTIPSFKDCFIADIALGALVSGPGNTISLTLTSNQR
ncbi:hypothetical protein SAMN05421504_10339 [Amycolatopsis xylanica]|uniref:Uncharacterized protein n=1 Tax=Amycolatopsis xylanica TaxID=589385 RepID=A0A1H3CHQ0_9PSEU|nr:hypothetical protein [Amycolatopsis xylanica]SDX53677.1 hypothetical protein SAMN05421504_10339 [Amycolatopsis xylanica]